MAFDGLAATLFAGAGDAAATGLGAAALDSASTAAIFGAEGYGASMTAAEVAASAGAGAGASGVMSGLGSAAGAIAPYTQLATGALGVYNGLQMSQMGQPSGGTAAANATLAQLLGNPSSVSNQPGFQAGMQAVERSGAANGYLGSGNMAASLAKYGSTFYNDSIKTLSDVANQGAGVQQSYNFAGAQLQGQGLNSLNYGIQKLAGWGG